MATTTLCAGILGVSPGPARASSTAARLQAARSDLRSVKHDLAGTKADYKIFKDSGLRVGGGWYRHAIDRLKRRVRDLRSDIARLERRLAAEKLDRAALKGDWLPIVRAVAAENHISAAGLYRLMSLESGGRAGVSTGTYHGLYQYASSTWRGAWNPWRSRSIYNGEAQIRATARAIKKGWGPRMWPNTYPMAF